MIRLFVYGGLMSGEIRKYKGIYIPSSHIRYNFIRHWRLTYNRKVKNCQKSKYHVADESTCTYFGMCNLEPKTKSVVYGKVLTVNKSQLQQIMSMEPGYKLVYINAQDVYTLVSVAKKYLDNHVPPNPIYWNIVEQERYKVQRKLNPKTRKQKK